MVARMTIGPTANMAGIAEAAGQCDEKLRWYESGILFVSGVTQKALEDAYASYTHSDTVIAQQRVAFKAHRANAVAQIRVTTSIGNTFDGDEIAQGRMARAILALPDGQTVRWVLHDNTEIDATAAELREALALAGADQARLWVKTE